MLHSVAVTWSAGQELELAPGEKLASDFILWYQRKQTFGNDYPTEIVFGEAKSFGREVFKTGYIAAMKRLAVCFPGSILVFLTMKEADEIFKEKVSRIAKFAEWGREYEWNRRHTRAPVIVLTSTELPQSRNRVEREGRSARAAYRTWLGQGGKPTCVLANLTQQLYLNMPTYESWYDAKRMKKLVRCQKNQSVQLVARSENLIS